MGIYVNEIEINIKKDKPKDPKKTIQLRVIYFLIAVAVVF